MRWIVLLLLASTVGFAQNVEILRESLEAGFYSKVVLLGAELLSQEPDNAEAHLLYAYGLYYTGDTAKARISFDTAQNLNIKPSAEVKHLSGLLKAIEGDNQGALDDLQAAFEESQDYQIAMNLGNLAWENNLSEKALEAFAKAAQTPYGQTQIWPELNRGRILQLNLQDYEAASEAYDRVIEIGNNYPDSDPLFDAAFPGYVEAFYRLGQISEELGDINLAISNYEAAYGQDPSYEPALIALERLSQ